MNDTEKRAVLASLIFPDVESDEVLDSMLVLSRGLVLNRMYPFGYPEGTTVPARYEQIEIQLAVEIYNQRGAEGQTAHSENGITRSWPEQSNLLRKIVPHCGSVISDA